MAGEVPGPTGNHHPTVAPYGSFRAADGQIILAVGNEVTWRRFAELLEIPPDAPRTRAMRAGWPTATNCRR